MSANKSILTGTLWVIAARWGIRGIGLISTIVLARLLTPSDFGVVAMAMIIVGAVEVFNETGLLLYLIRHPNPQDDHFNTVWTLRVLVGTGLAAILFLGAGPAAAFFREAAIEPAIRWLALRPLMIGLENPGTVWFRKDMQFQRDFEFMVINKVIAFVVTVGLALWLQNYWALIFGILAGGVASLVQSYRMHQYRPRFCLRHTRDAWGFSFWTLVQNMMVYLDSRLDELVVGRMKSTDSLGLYTVAADVAASPVREIVVPASRAIFPGFVRLASDPAALAHSFSRIQAGVACLALSVSTGIALVAHDLTYFLLGEEWLEAVPLLQILALSAGIFSVSQPIFIIMSALGQVRLSAFLSSFRILLLAGIVIPVALRGGLTEIAIGRLTATALATVVTVAVFVAKSAVPWRATAAAVLRPALATAVMVACVIPVQAYLDAPLVRLVASVLIGVAAFTAALLGIWRLCGRPDSIEADALALAGRVVRRLFRQAGFLTARSLR